MDESLTRYLEVPAKVLKLSEAIRIGSRMRPKSVRGFFVKGRTCAIGAAFEAAMGRPPQGALDDSQMHEFMKMFPAVQAFALGTEIVERNDCRNQSREEIADWLESKGY